jgi:hypothetical protein
MPRYNLRCLPEELQGSRLEYAAVVLNMILSAVELEHPSSTRSVQPYGKRIESGWTTARKLGSALVYITNGQSS